MIGFNITEANERSDTVTTVTVNGHDPQALQRYCKEKCGVVLGTGIGELQGAAFRIAHMGHVNAPMILGTLAVIDLQRDIIDDGKRSKTLGQAAQFNRRHSRSPGDHSCSDIARLYAAQLAPKTTHGEGGR